MTDVPQGTMKDALDWVGDDPGRAREALDAERAGPNRSTLISKLEAIASQTQEDTVSESSTERDTEERPSEPPVGPEQRTEPGEDEEPQPQPPEGPEEQPDEEDELEGEEAPPQPREVQINPADEGVVVFATVPRHRDVELPDDPIFGVPRPVATGATTTGTVRVGAFDREISDDEIAGEPIDGQLVEFLDGAADGRGFALGLNGEAFMLDAQMAAALKGFLDKAITGMAL